MPVMGINKKVDFAIVLFVMFFGIRFVVFFKSLFETQHFFHNKLQNTFLIVIG